MIVEGSEKLLKDLENHTQKVLIKMFRPLKKNIQLLTLSLKVNIFCICLRAHRKRYCFTLVIIFYHTNFDLFYT